MSTLRLRAAVGEDADERASGCLVAEAAEMTLRFRAAAGEDNDEQVCNELLPACALRGVLGRRLGELLNEPP